MKNVDVEGPQPEGHPHDHELAPVPLGSTLEDLQTEDQRRILDTITQLRKCGLDGILSLPDIVVCGDQSAGKSSVLEALTEIPFPRNDNLCTRFATEISLRRELTESLTVRVIPDNDRSQEDQKRIKEFSESITDLKDLAFIMDAATKVMGINNGDSSDSQSEQAPGSAFSKDTLSIEINGPDRPQLTLIDIPGLIQSATKGVSEADVAMVTEITDRYIKRPRTICLAVVSATNDAANQPILQRVRKFDPQGERTLGVITKPDQLPSGSGSESKFLELACNKDVFFKLGWHVIRNRRFDENGFSFEERNAAEAEFFRTSNFSVLPKDMVGIEALRARLSFLLFEHVKAQLPQLREDLERALQTDRDELNLLGDVRLTTAACRVYLTKLSMECQEICKAGLNGNYEHEYFKLGAEEMFSLKNKSTIARLRAAIQYSNSKFAEQVRKRGHKYIFSSETDEEQPSEQRREGDPTTLPKSLSQKESLAWVQKMLLLSRGTELIGNFNPHLIGELFWEQSQPWENLASNHIEQVSQLCMKFLTNLLEQKVPKEIQGRIWSFMVENTLKQRKQAAYDELAKLIRDIKDFPINYNHYYTDIIEQRRQERLENRLETFIAGNIAHVSHEKCSRGHHYEKYSPEIDARKLISSCLKSNSTTTTIDMDMFSGEEALDCLQAIYKVQYKTFLANVTTQVVERQMIRGLDKIFSPLVVISMADNEVNTITAERPATKRQRLFLTNRVQKLEEGRRIFQELISTQFVPEVNGN
ncbi:dynamin family protein [Colletotrichum truncatum]|uniref:Dynamin family protein n=1 Tax=Colletotrichum truncatum TaxID=5467 RepID=A0ACC3ZBJ0_COLTU|nr:dynamin family protein [Colletotrichum truncatum]KAF6787811.1 dynamin family protein [Colletotrichum truncatum]